MQEGEKIKIFLVDDHQIVIDGIKNLLRKEDRLWIVGEATEAEDVLEYLAHNSLDLLITDIEMPGMNGLELTKLVKERHPQVKVLVLSVHHDEEKVQQIFDAHAEGYLLKNTSRQELKQAIHKLIDGGTFYSREVLQVLMGQLSPPATTSAPRLALSPREQEILQLISEEHTSHEIAERLFISPRTVETHRKNILQKTGVKSTIGLIKFGLKQGLISLA